MYLRVTDFLLLFELWMILPQDSMDATIGASAQAAQVSPPPPSYVAENEDQRNIDPYTKTPVPPPANGGGSDIVGSYSNEGSSGLTRPRRPSFEFSPASSAYAVDRSIPAAFNRMPPPNFSYASFDPMFLIALGKSLDKGFPSTAPPSNARPHPFADHDVTEQEWLGFVNAIRSAASLTEKDIQRSHLPIISIVPIVNILSEVGVQKIMKSRKSPKVAKLLNQWNHHFFGPRKMRVILMKGKERMSGFTETSSSDGQLAKSPHSMTPSAPDDNVYRLFVVPIVDS